MIESTPCKVTRTLRYVGLSAIGAAAVIAATFGAPTGAATTGPKPPTSVTQAAVPPTNAQLGSAAYITQTTYSASAYYDRGNGA